MPRRFLLLVTDDDPAAAVAGVRLADAGEHVVVLCGRAYRDRFVDPRFEIGVIDAPPAALAQVVAAAIAQRRCDVVVASSRDAAALGTLACPVRGFDEATWREGTVSFRGRRLWYAIAGADQPGIPLLCVPGGPGLPHDYLRPLAALAARGRPVIFYDEIGAGRSEPLAGVEWTLDLLAEELEVLGAGLPCPQVHLFAHSAGGYAALTHAVRRPPGLAGLVLCSTPADVADYMAGVRGMVAALPPVFREPLERQFREQEQGVDPPQAARTPAYARAMYEFIGRHVCRRPACLPALFAAERKRNAAMFAHLRGRGGQLLYDGTLRDWSIMDRLGDVAVPTLFTCGAFDSLHLPQCRAIAAAIPRARLEVIEDCAHLQFVEAPEVYLDLVDSFLSSLDPT